MENVSMKPWKDIPKRERQNLDYLKAMREKYQDAYGDQVKSKRDWVDIDNAIFNLEEEAQKKAERKEKMNARLELAEIGQEEGSEASQIRKKIYQSIIDKTKVYFVAEEGLYYLWEKQSRRWLKIKSTPLFRQFQVKHIDDFNDVMVENGRNKLYAEYSFSETTKESPRLNLLTREHWLKPKKGEVNKWLSVLLSSLGNGNPMIIEHIEQCVYWKYTHPEAFRIPCLILYGTGGVGRNTFVTGPLQTIFGANQVAVVDFNMGFGAYNGMLQGQTVVLIDETVSEKSDSNKMKAVVGNQTFALNEKFGKQGECRNTAWYIAGGNDRTGALLLDGTSSDRRWSLIKLDYNIVHHTLVMLGEVDTLEEARVLPATDPKYEAALEEFTKNEKVLSDPDVIGAWLGYILEKWKGLEFCPREYHDKDYDDLLDRQKRPIDHYLEMLFNEEGFEYISGVDLWNGFVAYVDAYAQSYKRYVGGKGGKNTWFYEVNDWLVKHDRKISKKKFKIKDVHKRLHATTGYGIDGKKTYEEHKRPYFVDDGKGGSKFDFERFEYLEPEDDDLVGFSSNLINFRSHSK